MKPKQINLETATIDELKIAVYDLQGEKDNLQFQINGLNQQIQMLNQTIRDKFLKENKELPVVEEPKKDK